MAQKRVKPSKRTETKIYLRTPKKKSLKITSKTVEEAMRLPAAKPKKKSGVLKVLSAKTEVVAMPKRPAGAVIAESYKPFNQPVGEGKSQPSFKTSPLKGTGGKKAQKSLTTRVLPTKKLSEKPTKKTAKSRSILPYDHQPMFQDGFRIVQGGLPELGKRR